MIQPVMLECIPGRDLEIENWMKVWGGILYENQEWE